LADGLDCRLRRAVVGGRRAEGRGRRADARGGTGVEGGGCEEKRTATSI
jgi:hypothetical protein